MKKEKKKKIAKIITWTAVAVVFALIIVFSIIIIDYKNKTQTLQDKNQQLEEILNENT